MKTSRPDRVVRTLTALASFAYFFMWAGGVLILIALPTVKAFGGGGFYFSLELPVTAPSVQAVVQTTWGAAPLLVDEVRGELKLPISAIPWSFLTLLWIYTATAGGLILLFLHNLRRIFQRVRDGAAFDAQNVARFRTLGLLLAAIAGLKAVAELTTSIAVRRGLAPDSTLAVPAGIHVDGTLVVVALVVMALTEVFRRGTELEHEQSLVI